MAQILIYILLIFLSIFLYFKGVEKYRTLLNPATIFIVYQIIFLTILSSLTAFARFEFEDFSTIYIEKTLIIAAIYLFGVIIAYYFPLNYLKKIIYYFIINYFIRIDKLFFKNKNKSILFLLITGATSFLILAHLGGGGLLWLESPRDAYMFFRGGAGIFYAICQWSLTFLFLLLIWDMKNINKKFIFITLVITFFLYFLGSKHNILSIFILIIFFYNFRIRLISYCALFILFIAMLFLFVLLFVLQGSSILEVFNYFSDYVYTTSYFLLRFKDDFNYTLGYGFVSDFWYYVPRSLYELKPYEYGTTLIHAILYPGAAEKGHTPGVLPWSLWYLDFGVLGVFFTGFMAGTFQIIFFESYMNNKNNYFLFIIANQFSLFPFLNSATPIMTLILLILYSYIIRLRF
jgi:hypothetical protein